MSSQNNDFPTITPQEWKLKVQAELAGLDYNEVLVWDTFEGIQVKPVYTKEDAQYQDLTPEITNKDWKIIGNFLDDPKQDFSYLYGFNLKDEFIGKTSTIPEYLDLFFTCENPFQLIAENDFSKIPNLKYLGLDVLGNFARTGNWYKSEKEDFDLVEQILNENSFEKSILVDASLYQNAGANHVQQIAFAIAHGNEYLQKFGTETAHKIYFKTAIGSNYFFEIAKLKAIRKLWNLILEEYNSDAETFIYAETSLRNKSILDIQNNIIRSGLEASSAVQGKADVVSILPYDTLKNSTSFSEELASKQQLLLQRESYFDKFHDPVAGSFFVENLTDLFCKNALDLFKKIEAEGGFLKGLFEGSIQKMITKSAEKEQTAFDEGKLTLIGVNKFRNKTENVEPITDETPKNVRTLIQPIFPKRLSTKIEKAT